jgi:exodeoxyribonuclease X
VRVIILDTETTGVSLSDKVIELALYEAEDIEIEQLQLDCTDLQTLRETIEVSRYNPRCMINTRAFEVHGIGLMDLQDCPNSNTLTLPENIVYMIGHNIESFDRRLLIQSNPSLAETLKDTKYICTLALAKAVDKHLNIGYVNHKLDTLAAHYYPEHRETLVTELHSAKNDVLKTLLVLLKLVEHLPALKTYDDIYVFQESLKKVKGKAKVKV